jgi:chromosome segregation ATPase
LEDDVKSAVLTALQQQAKFADDTRNSLEAKRTDMTQSADKLHAEIDGLKRSIEKSKTVKVTLWEEYHTGSISASAFQLDNKKVDEQVKTQIEKIAEIKHQIQELEDAAGHDNEFVEQFSKQAGITELTRAMVEEFIQEIKVFSPERIEIIFNYADEYKKILDLTKSDVTGCR